MEGKSSRRTAVKLFGGLAAYTAGVAILYEGGHNVQEGSKRTEIAEDAHAVQKEVRPLQHPQIHDVSWDVEIDAQGTDTFDFRYMLETETDFTRYRTGTRAAADTTYVETVGADVFKEMVNHLGQYGGTEYKDLSTYQITFDGRNGSLTYSMEFEELVDEYFQRDVGLEDLYHRTLDHDHLRLTT